MSEPETDDSHLAKLVRTLDRTRYYATLFAPAPIRADLFALYAFAAEIERIPDLVSEPALGEIRLQYWCDRLEALPSAPGDGGPVLRGVETAVARHKLPIAPLMALVDARRADLYSDPPATIADLEGLLGETQSALFQMAAIVCGAAGPESAVAAGHAGVAYGLARRLAAFAHERARNRTILPRDALEHQGLSAADIFATNPAPGIAPVVAGLAKHAQLHLRQARAASVSLPQLTLPAFLPLATVAPLLRRLERSGARLQQQRAELSDLELLSRIAWARLKGRP